MPKSTHSISLGTKKGPADRRASVTPLLRGRLETFSGIRQIKACASPDGGQMARSPKTHGQHAIESCRDNEPRPVYLVGAMSERVLLEASSSGRATASQHGEAAAFRFG
jgi:hypothetical protein